MIWPFSIEVVRALVQMTAEEEFEANNQSFPGQCLYNIMMIKIMIKLNQ